MTNENDTENYTWDVYTVTFTERLSKEEFYYDQNEDLSVIMKEIEIIREEMRYHGPMTITPETREVDGLSGEVLGVVRK